MRTKKFVTADCERDLLFDGSVVGVVGQNGAGVAPAAKEGSGIWSAEEERSLRARTETAPTSRARCIS